MQVIQELQINNHKISLYNTVEEPLFDAKQVIETVLEYRQLEDCRFYKDNKRNEDFVQIQASGRLPVGQKGIKGLDNQHSNTTIYLTEFGLYRCLFTSQKPIAIEFQEQVARMLKDIRIGNLRLIVQKECETTKLLQANTESLLAEITKRSELEKQVLYLQARLEKASEEVAVYEIEIDGKIYRGTALQLIRRLKQHLTNSSNSSVRQLINSKKTTRSFSTGAEVKMRLLHTQKVSNRDERNYIESEFIKRIPSTQRLNRNIPRVRDFSNVSEECKSELSTSINNPVMEEMKVQINSKKNPQVTLLEQQIDLTTIGENIKEQDAFEEKWDRYYIKYKRFTETLERNPKDSTDREEKLLAKWVYKQRNAYHFLSQQKQEKLDRIKHFKPEVKQINTDEFEVKLAKVKAIYEQTKETTSAVLGSLAHWYRDYSEKMKNNTISEYQRRLFELSGIPLHITPKEQWMVHYNQCLDIFTRTRKIPVDKQVPGEFNLGKWVRRQISENFAQLDQHQIKLLADIGIKEKKNTSGAQYLQFFKEFLQTHKKLPSATGDQQEAYLYKWMNRNKEKPIVQQLINNISK